MKKNKIEIFKEIILQNLRNNFQEIFVREFTTFSSKCEVLCHIFRQVQQTDKSLAKRVKNKRTNLPAFQVT